MIKRSVYIALLLLAAVAVVVADFLAPRHDVHFFWDNFPGWSALYGFISCIAIIFISKFLGHQFGLMHKIDYYENNDSHKADKKKEKNSQSEINSHGETAKTSQQPPAAKDAKGGDE
ncbi:hypothetical protein ACQKP8_16320 [Photobacterium alginatilyticum]|uniref:hypothetical protein n=1 Tax=Photobacterium alginatilyticum TaxID=1775171 RepID=UPI004067A4C6